MSSVRCRDHCEPGGASENLVRGLRPSLQRNLLAENLFAFAVWSPAPAAEAAHSAITSAVLVAVYTVAAVVIAMVVFTRRDIVKS